MQLLKTLGVYHVRFCHAPGISAVLTSGLAIKHYSKCFLKTKYKEDLSVHASVVTAAWLIYDIWHELRLRHFTPPSFHPSAHSELQHRLQVLPVSLSVCRKCDWISCSSWSLPVSLLCVCVCERDTRWRFCGVEINTSIPSIYTHTHTHSQCLTAMTHMLTH